LFDILDNCQRFDETLAELSPMHDVVSNKFHFYQFSSQFFLVPEFDHDHFIKKYSLSSKCEDFSSGMHQHSANVVVVSGCNTLSCLIRSYEGIFGKNKTDLIDTVQA